MALGGSSLQMITPWCGPMRSHHGISRDPGEGNHLTPLATKQQKRENGLRPHSPLQDISFLRLP